jgi:hypothetical protein
MAWKLLFLAGFAQGLRVESDPMTIAVRVEGEDDRSLPVTKSTTWQEIYGVLNEEIDYANVSNLTFGGQEPDDNDTTIDDLGIEDRGVVFCILQPDEAKKQARERKKRVESISVSMVGTYRDSHHGCNYYQFKIRLGDKEVTTDPLRYSRFAGLKRRFFPHHHNIQLPDKNYFSGVLPLRWQGHRHQENFPHVLEQMLKASADLDRDEFSHFVGVVMHYHRAFDPKTDPAYNLRILLRPDLYIAIGY